VRYPRGFRHDVGTLHTIAPCARRRRSRGLPHGWNTATATLLGGVEVDAEDAGELLDVEAAAA